MHRYLTALVLLIAFAVPSLSGAQTPAEAVPASVSSPKAQCEAGLVEKYGQEDLTRIQPGFRFTLFERTYPIALGEMPGDVCARAIADQALLASKDALVLEAQAKAATAEGQARELKEALDRELRPNAFKENYEFYVVGFFTLLIIVLIKPICSFLFFLWRVFSIIVLGWRWQKSGKKWSRQKGGTLSKRNRARGASFF